MECQKLEITLVSAENLPNVRKLGPMEVYAEVSLDGNLQTKKTHVDKEGRENPIWNLPVEFTIRESALQQRGLADLVVKLFCKRTLGDRLIGTETKISVKSLFDKGIEADKNLSYTVSGTPGGKLNISYSFGEKIVVPEHLAKSLFETPGPKKGKKVTAKTVGDVMGVVATVAAFAAATASNSNGESEDSDTNDNSE